MKTQALLFLILCLLSASGLLKAQVNSGSNGSDGAFHPTQNITIDMNLRPDGIYHYTSVNIPAGVTVSFIPNANNTPVVWLVQGDCVVHGHINISGGGSGGIAGPGGSIGGNGGSLSAGGEGLGGGAPGQVGGNASYGTEGQPTPDEPGKVYGNQYLIPLFGGSGGGGATLIPKGAAGGGALMIAASGSITVNGTINANGGDGILSYAGGAGSGGAVRFIAQKIQGNANGMINCRGGRTSVHNGPIKTAGNGRIRFDCLVNQYGGNLVGAHSQGFQPIIIPAVGQGTQLSIQSVGGLAVAANPNGVLANPDVVIPAQQQNPMNVVIGCSNLPLNTLITVVVRPASGPEIVATGRNTNGSQASSTATIPVEMPRGGGIVFARCVSGVNGVSSTGKGSDVKNIAHTGWTADGETFSQIEITAGLGGSQQVAYLTASGKRYALPQK